MSEDDIRKAARNADSVVRSRDGSAAVGAIIEAAAEPEPELEAEATIKEAGDAAEEQHCDAAAADPLANLVQRATDDPGAPFEPAVLKVLARLRDTDPATWQRLRSDLKNAKVRVPDLDCALNRLSGGPGANSDGRTGRPLKPKEIEPWHAEVDGIALLDELSRRFCEYVIMPQTAADAVALWAVHTHALEGCHYTPRLFITSPDKRCGKSRLLRVIGKTVACPLNAGNISSASFFRTVQAIRPTLLVDEFDAHKKDDDEIRGVINNGYERGNPNIRCDPNTLEPLEFETFAACAIASIGRTWETVEDRSIIILLHRKRPSERVRKFRRNRAPELDKLAGMAARWALDHIDAIETANPKTPEALSDRAADIWEPLLAIADLSGGNWPTRARHAALVLSGDGVVEDESFGVMLLADLRGLFNSRGSDALATKNIIEYLATLDERPWPVYGRGRSPINAKQLVDILKPFGIRSNTVRIDGTTLKGYRRKDIEHAAGRYLPDSPVTTSQPTETLENLTNSAVTSNANVTDENRQKGKDPAGCDVVTARKGGKADEGGMEGVSAPEEDDADDADANIQAHPGGWKARV